MKRALPWILTLLVVGAAAVGLYTLARRERGQAPTTGPITGALFTASPAGAGALFQLHAAADQPLRGVRFLPALPDGEVLAQVLTQTGDQLVGRFSEGKFVGTSRLQVPDDAPQAFFRFANLEDATVLSDHTLLLLYTDGTGGGSAPWLVAMSPDGATRWSVKGTGTHIALEPSGKSCLLWDAANLGRVTWTGAASFKSLPLPDGVSVLDAVLPLAGGRMMLTHPGGLAVLTGGAWTLTPLPDPNDLSFPGSLGVLAAAGDAVYWQPRPGQLAKAEPDGTISPIQLSQLAAPADRVKDLDLLRLVGADTRGRLWFRLATPDLTVAPHAVVPVVAEPPSPALAAAAALTSSSAAPTPEPEAPAPFDPAPWMDYLKGGLDRVYVWDPKANALTLIDWKARWAALGAPSDFTLPLPRSLQPQGGALLLDLDTRAWWLPLEKIAP